MNDEWYYSVNSDRQGPVSWDQLRDLAAAGTLKPADLVWKDGMAEWAEAKTVAGLIPPGGAAPRPARRNDAADDDRPRPRRRDRDDDDADDRPRRRPAR